MEGRRTVFNKQKLKTLVSAPRELETFHMPIYLPPPPAPRLNTAAKNQLAREAPAHCVANTSPSTLDGTSATLAVQGVSLQGRVAIFKNYMSMHDMCGERKDKWFMAMTSGTLCGNTFPLLS